MFTAGFKEKEAKEIPLPGKNFDDVVELLLCVTPAIQKPISGITDHFSGWLFSYYKFSFCIAKSSCLFTCKDSLNVVSIDNVSRSTKVFKSKEIS